MTHEVAVAIGDEADLMEARRLGRELASHLGFSKTDMTLIATAISEIARNIVLYAAHGEVRFQAVEDQGRNGLRVTASDYGPGITDVARAMQDGYSSHEGLGIGLPGARRLMDEFEIKSEVGVGTTVVMTKWVR